MADPYDLTKFLAKYSTTLPHLHMLAYPDTCTVTFCMSRDKHSDPLHTYQSPDVLCSLIFLWGSASHISTEELPLRGYIFFFNLESSITQCGEKGTMRSMFDKVLPILGKYLLKLLLWLN